MIAICYFLHCLYHVSLIRVCASLFWKPKATLLVVREFVGGRCYGLLYCARYTKDKRLTAKSPFLSIALFPCDTPLIHTRHRRWQ
jgi:hypothetical protein